MPEPASTGTALAIPAAMLTASPLPPPKASPELGQALPGTMAALLLAALGLTALCFRLRGPGSPGKQNEEDKAQGASPLPSLPPSLFSRSHHEKLHDAKYLQRILEAEGQSDGPPAPAPGNADTTPPPAGPSPR